MKKKYLVLLLAFMLIFALAACGDDSNGNNGNGAETYTVTFDYGDNYTAVEKNSKINVPPTPTRDGYDFDYWYTYDTSFNMRQWNFNSDTVTSDIALYAKWTPKVYTITYRDVGGTDFSGRHELYGTPTSHTYGTATTLRNPTKTNYLFYGWFVSESGTGNSITSLSATGYMADITLYAKWEVDNSISVADLKAKLTWFTSLTTAKGFSYDIKESNGQRSESRYRMIGSTNNVTAAYLYTFANLINLEVWYMDNKYYGKSTGSSLVTTNLSTSDFNTYLSAQTTTANNMIPVYNTYLDYARNISVSEDRKTITYDSVVSAGEVTYTHKCTITLNDDGNLIRLYINHGNPTRDYEDYKFYHSGNITPFPSTT